jgi:carbamoyl-phosphate synthase small subunit
VTTLQTRGEFFPSDAGGRKPSAVTLSGLSNDTLEGMRHRQLPAFSVQYHPEAPAGPHDSGYLLEEFQKLMG